MQRGKNNPGYAVPFKLSDQDEVGCGAGQRGRAADAGGVRDADQEALPDLHLVLGLLPHLLSRPPVPLLRPVLPVGG